MGRGDLLGRVDLGPAEGSDYDAELSADVATWQRIADDVRGGMSAFRRGSLRVRRNLHLGVGFLAATSGLVEPGRLQFTSVATRVGKLSTLAAGRGSPVICIHGLGATKASFLPTVAALADDWRVIAVDLPGFGESDKPLGAAYDAPYFAGAVTALLDELGIERAHLIGNSMGGRVAIEVGLLYPERVGRIALLSPALAWLRDRRWRWLLRAPLPMLGLIQPAPRVITEPIVRSLVPGAGTVGRPPASMSSCAPTSPRVEGSPSMRPPATSTSTSLTERKGCGRVSRGCRRKRCSSGDATTSWCRSAFASMWSGLCPRPVTSSSIAPTCPNSRRRRKRTGQSASSSPGVRWGLLAGRANAVRGGQVVRGSPRQGKPGGTAEQGAGPRS